MPPKRLDRSRWLPGLLLITIFIAGQIASADYGTTINNTPTIAAYQVDTRNLQDNLSQRRVIVEQQLDERENLDRWMMRFKLYSVEADDIVNIIALAQIRPRDGQFDPHFYQYGGAYLYPLGGWLLALKSAGFIQIRTLTDMLGQPDNMDRVWVAGRIFVILAVALSAVFFLATLNLFTPQPIALPLLSLYLCCPAAIMFSDVLKPHWYALLWVAPTLFLTVRGYTNSRFSLGDATAAGLSTGLAVGSALTFAIFSIGIGFAVIDLIRRRIASPIALVIVPTAAFVALIASNPYYILNWPAFSAERAAVAENWFRIDFNFPTLTLFLDNSVLVGLGISLALMLAVALAYWLTQRPSPQMFVALFVTLTGLAISALTASMAKWHMNLRYVPYILPIGLLLIAATPWLRRPAILWLVVVATAAQSAPLKIARFDENDPGHSTRFQAAAWIDANIPQGAAICVGTTTLAPYDVPPFSFTRYAINGDGCHWHVAVERETDSAEPPAGSRLIQRFRPRLSPESFPLVVGHANPQISIYRRD